MDFLKRLLSDSDGTPSTMRFMAIITTLSACYLALFTQADHVIIIGMLSNAFAMKGIQSFAEKK